MLERVESGDYAGTYNVSTKIQVEPSKGSQAAAGCNEISPVEKIFINARDMAGTAASSRRPLALAGVPTTFWAMLLIAICAAAAAAAAAALSSPSRRPPELDIRTVDRAGVLRPARPPEADNTTTTTTGWHVTGGRRIENAELVPLMTIQPGRLEVVRHPAAFGTTPLLAKVATDPHEAAVYRLLDGLEVAPRLLGLVTEDGRAVGLLAEYVSTTTAAAWGEDASSRQHHEMMEEEKEQSPRGMGAAGRPRRRRRLEACLGALRRMHARGLAHGDAHGGNCLLRADGSAALVDFELSVETTSQAEFDRDLWIMSHTVDD